MIESYRDLHIWKRSVELSIALYQLTANFPREEIYGLTNQLRRASVSIASNIAEGYGRGSRGEYKQFLAMAIGSNFEVQTQLVIVKELQYCSSESIDRVESLSIEVGKMLTVILKKLRVRRNDER
jgi:four helix bundle protein